VAVLTETGILAAAAAAAAGVVMCVPGKMTVQQTHFLHGPSVKFIFGDGAG